MTDEQLWKKRFAVFAMARLFGVGFLLLGIGIAFTDLIAPGGWPELGAVIAIVGVIDAVLVPRLLRKAWAQADAEDGRFQGPISR